jgi:hypothetical protein
MAKSVDQILKEKQQGVTARANIESHWQSLHDYFDNVGMDINTQFVSGNELTITNLYDTYSLETADVLAAGLNNYLTPSASRWFGFRTKDPLKMEKKRVLHYLKDVEAEVQHALNNSNYYNVVPDFYKKSGVYGTSILFQEEDPFDGLRFYSLPLRSVTINKDARERVTEYCIEFEYTAMQAVTRFGPNKVHQEVLKSFKENRDPNKKYKYTLYIGPNWERNPMALDNKNKAWISMWIDDEHRTEIDRGGFDEQPALTHFFYTRSDELWGFSPAMKALQDARLLNAKAKTAIRSDMKYADPPVAMPDNAFLHPYNGNPRGTNFYKAGSLTSSDIFPIGAYGHKPTADAAIEYSKERLRSQMFTDVFRAFDGITKQMNNPEVYERIAEKMTLLGPAVGRFLNVNDQVLHRAVGLLQRQGRLPEPPPEILEDPSYEIDYLSALAKAQRNTELKSLQNAMLMAGEMANYSPNVIDKIDPDKGIDVIWGITGAPVQMLRDDDEVKAIRDNRAQQQADEQRAAMIGAGADVALKATQASKNVREAQAIG